MKKLFFVLFCAVAASVIAVSCSEDKDGHGTLPGLKVAADTVYVEAAGGECHVAYELSGVPEGTVPEVSIEDGCDWLSLSQVSGGRADFTVAANGNPDGREAVVTLTCGEVSDEAVIAQSGKWTGSDPDAIIRVNVADITSISAVVEYSCDEGVRYYLGMSYPIHAAKGVISKEELSSYDSDAEFIAVLYEELLDAAAHYSTIEEYLIRQEENFGIQQLFSSDSYSYTGTSLDPSTEYVAYAVEVKDDWTFGTELFKCEFTTAATGTPYDNLLGTWTLTSEMAFNHKDWLKDEPVVKTLRFEDNLGAGYFKYNTGEIIPGIIAYGLASTDGNLPVFVNISGNDDGSIYLMSFRGGDCYGSYEEYRVDSFLYEGEDELGHYRVHWLGMDFTPELDA